ncbi:TldD protein, part of proposed TldE/TldD proteolytic complex (PMID 12029038) [Crocosphaera watsonii WH 0005]|uniref:TldD protein, part of proposed TldE/TldD proteolytic complex (PMID 12029038) n=1 Tax=Crocosphaera watsonii WH 0005 TaxID=423472 RepID=T2INV3_CROWT|nr:TldD protein, part of proposed TldE/TldD proteolytic complex (PMID 12029038) [Crocosphaera watsonii WH 0005]
MERVNYISCLAEEDAITSISPRLSSGAGIRIFKGKADCYVSTNDLSFKGLKNGLRKGVIHLRFNLTLP